MDQELEDEVFANLWRPHDVLWLLGDYQGTIRDIADASSTLRKLVDYDSFGNILEETFYDETGEQVNRRSSARASTSSSTTPARNGMLKAGSTTTTPAGTIPELAAS